MASRQLSFHVLKVVQLVASQIKLLELLELADSAIEQLVDHVVTQV